MTTNVQGTRQSNRPGEPTTGESMPVITPLGAGGVAVYDVDKATDPTRPSASLLDDRVIGDRVIDNRGPAEVQSTGSIMTWIIGAIVLIVLAYFLLQFVF